MFERLSHLEPKHWMLIAAFLTATGSVVGGLHSWAELFTPPVVGGLLGQLAVMIGAIFVGAPANPNK